MVSIHPVIPTRKCKPIILNLQNIGNSYRLVISSVVEKDYGDYSCRASNPLEEEVSQKIVVTGKS